MFSANEHDSVLNNVRVLDRVRRQLEDVGVFTYLVGSSDAWGTDAVLRLAARGGLSRTYGVQLRRRMTPELATAVHAPSDLPALVVAPMISGPVGERLRARGVDYVDTAGNIHLAWEGLLIDIRGRRQPVERSAMFSERGAKAFGQAGLKTQFVLLSWPDLTDAPLREISRAAGVSLGTAKMVVDELENAGYLHRGSHGRRLAHGRELLDRWTEAYSVALDPKLTLARFSVDDITWWRDSPNELEGLDIQIGGEAGGSVLDAHLYPSTLTLYVAAVPSVLVGRRHMTKQGTSGNVVFRKRFWTAPKPSRVLVPTPLIYADMLASGDPRQREHADRIRAGDDQLKWIDAT